MQPLRATRFYDADGTLLECGIYYDQQLQAGGKYLAAALKLPADLAEHMIREIDITAVKLPGQGWNRDRFPKSFAAAAYAACALVDHPTPWNSIATEAWNIGDAVFNAEYALYPGVKETLERDRAAGYQMVLITKGDPEVQQLKINRHDLDQYFDHVFIVPSKGPEELRVIVEQVNADVATSWMIGDSKKDDIAPAQAVGLKTALVERGAHSWKYNDHDIDAPTLVVESVADVPVDIDQRAVAA
jgi:putative hydrolase of the HAD superfamily